MSGIPPIPPARDKLLFTPGPLTTSASVKQAMLHDAGSWHFEFNARVREVRQKLLRLAGVSGEEYACVLLQGSGTFGVESVLGSVVPPEGKLLVVANGAYGERMIVMAQHLKIATVVLRTPENEVPALEVIEQALATDAAITHVAVVHCETTTGLLNPVHEIATLVSKRGRSCIVDAMSSFGAVPLDFSAGIDFLVSSANKCIEGVPGFSFVIARQAKLLECEGRARSLSLDLLAQWRGFEKNGQFRFTPPTHSILAFAQALVELQAEGGVEGRAARYRENHAVLTGGMRELGFQSYLAAEVQSYIITSFYYPADANFTFADFYRRLSDKGFIIYPGKISQAELFRIGNIGRLFPADMRSLVLAIGDTLREMGVSRVGPA